VGIFYFLIIRPQQKRQKETQKMLESVRKGDRVLTSGGIFGTVVGTKDDVVVLKVSDEVKVEFTKSSIVQVKERGE
jgi:preprotein translocase subunit YajC